MEKEVFESIKSLHEKFDNMSEKINLMPCQVNNNRIKNLEKIVYGTIKIILVSFIISVVSLVFYQSTGKTEVQKIIKTK